MLSVFWAWVNKNLGHLKSKQSSILENKTTVRKQFSAINANAIPKIIWLAWLQGYEQAPEIVSACFATWKKHNPDWTIHILTSENMDQFLDKDDAFAVVEGKNLEPEAFSDVLRLALLQRYGGIWVDATVYCLRPLNDWLPENVSKTGFFVFEKPTHHRMISSWFIAATKGNYIIQQWHNRTQQYWLEHSKRNQYFWVHHLFEETYTSDTHFKKIWDATPKVESKKLHYYLRLPHQQMLYKDFTDEDETLLTTAPIPMTKLSHKLKGRQYPDGSVLRYLCDKANEKTPNKPETLPASKPYRLLVTWYGTIDGHGTIGDLLAMKSVTSHLVGKGHCVSHASAADVHIYGAKQVDISAIAVSQFDAMIFVCGPIIKGHKKSSLLFEKFKDCYKLGVGVSLFSQDHKNYINPFDAVLAREGQPQQFDDVAVLAPRTAPYAEKHTPTGEITIGIVLRGNQTEYGAERCLWQETEKIVSQVTESLLAEHGGQIIKIENHLRNAGVPAHEIEAQYAKCDLVITSRFHGAMLAARYSVPFIAIDQIAGGAKISAMLGFAGWAHVFQIENTSTEQILESAQQLLKTGFDETWQDQRDQAILRANLTLTQMDQYLDKNFRTV